MAFSTLLLEREANGIGLVTFNRPDKLNALNSTVISELAAVVAELARDDAVRGVIFTGSGNKAFVAGADISELAEMDRGRGIAFAERGSRVLREIEQLGKPVIAAVNGFALGGGCELAMACHIRIAATNARFGQPEVKLGVIPGFGGTVRLPRLVGRGRAFELLMTGDPIDAEEAFRIGLVNRVVAPDALLATARTMLAAILARGPLAIRLCLQSVDEGLDASLDDALAREAALFGDSCASDDSTEGTRAFLERRPPVFGGR